MMEMGIPSFDSVNELHGKEYFEVIDSLVGDLKNQFKQKNFIFIQKLEILLLASANGRLVTLPKEIIEIMKKYQHTKLKFHLQLLPDAKKSMPQDGIPIRESHKYKQVVIS